MSKTSRKRDQAEKDERKSSKKYALLMEHREWVARLRKERVSAQVLHLISEISQRLNYPSEILSDLEEPYEETDSIPYDFWIGLLTGVSVALDCPPREMLAMAGVIEEDTEDDGHSTT